MGVENDRDCTVFAEERLDVCLPGLLRNAAPRSEAVAIRHNELSRWREYTWAEYATRTARIGIALLELGVSPAIGGDSQ